MPIPRTSGRPGPLSAAGRAAGGFSLIEVALALMVVAVGLLSAFSLFPVSLRSSQMARSDLAESAFADTLLQTIEGNVRAIDDVAVWNDPKEFWKAAAAGTGLATSITDAKNGSQHVLAEYKNATENGAWTGRASKSNDGKFSPKLTFVAKNALEDGEENIWYVAEERDKTEAPSGNNGTELVKPAQFLVRLARVKRNAAAVGGGAVQDGGTQALLPNVYIVSVVSTDRGFPDVFIREPLFTQEFTFVHRP
jgi:Tfp pilus assembly protein PilV